MLAPLRAARALPKPEGITQGLPPSPLHRSRPFTDAKHQRKHKQEAVLGGSTAARAGQAACQGGRHAGPAEHTAAQARGKDFKTPRAVCGVCEGQRRNEAPTSATALPPRAPQPQVCGQPQPSRQPRPWRLARAVPVTGQVPVPTAGTCPTPATPWGAQVSQQLVWPGQALSCVMSPLTPLAPALPRRGQAEGPLRLLRHQESMILSTSPRMLSRPCTFQYPGVPPSLP